MPIFRDFWIRHRIFHLAITWALGNESLTEANFVSSIEAPEQQFNLLADVIIGGPLTRTDFDSEGTVSDSYSADKIKRTDVFLL